MTHFSERIRGERISTLMTEAPNVRWLDDAVLVKLDKAERISASKRLYIPDSAKRQPHELYQGIVTGVGPGMLRLKDGKRNRPDVCIGDRVCFYWAAATMDVTALFAKDGTEYRVLSEKSIQGVLD